MFLLLKHADKWLHRKYHFEIENPKIYLGREHIRLTKPLPIGDGTSPPHTLLPLALLAPWSSRLRSGEPFAAPDDLAQGSSDLEMTWLTYCAGATTGSVHSQQHTYMSSSYRSNRLRLSHWDPHAMHRVGCLELYYCNMMEWFWCDWSLISTTNWFNHPWNDL